MIRMCVALGADGSGTMLYMNPDVGRLGRFGRSKPGGNSVLGADIVY